MKYNNTTMMIKVLLSITYYAFTQQVHHNNLFVFRIESVNSD